MNLNISGNSSTFNWMKVDELRLSKVLIHITSRRSRLSKVLIHITSRRFVFQKCSSTFIHFQPLRYRQCILMHIVGQSGLPQGPNLRFEASRLTQGVARCYPVSFGSQTASPESPGGVKLASVTLRRRPPAAGFGQPDHFFEH